MYKKNTSSWLKHWDFILIDFVLLQFTFLIAYVMRNGWNNPYDTDIYRTMAVIIGLLDLCVGFFMESYKGILRRGYWRELIAVTSHMIMVTAGMIIYLFMIKESSSYSRLVMFYFPIISVVILYIGRLARKIYLRTYVKPETAKRSIVLVGAKCNYQEMIDVFRSNPYSDFQVVGISLLDGDEDGIDEYNGVTIIPVLQLLSSLKGDWVDEVLFNIPKGYPMPDTLIDKCNLMGITVHVKLSWMDDYQVVEKIEDYIVISNSISMVSQKQMFIKRAMDICGGIAGLLITGVIFIFVAPVIYIKSPGPIFFTQWRVGKNGRKFKMYKFRSMYLDAEQRKKELMEQNNIKDGRMFKMDNDPRIIRGIGNFIRDYSLDEFPQFWNVLKGDMSLVGTRPPTVDEWEKYQYHHRSRLAIKPGITGMWQVSGRSKITDFEEVVRLDTKYIREWNVGLDIKIILKTILIVLGKDGAM